MNTTTVTVTVGRSGLRPGDKIAAPPRVAHDEYTVERETPVVPFGSIARLLLNRQLYVKMYDGWFHVRTNDDSLYNPKYNDTYATFDTQIALGRATLLFTPEENA